MIFVFSNIIWITGQNWTGEVQRWKAFHNFEGDVFVGFFLGVSYIRAPLQSFHFPTVTTVHASE